MLVCLLAIALLTGCGDSSATRSQVPTRVPAGAVAVVSAAPVTLTSFAHWLAVRERSATTGASAASHRRARQATIAYLVKAQWLIQEARAEGINDATVRPRVAQRIAVAPAAGGPTAADLTFEARLDVLAEALSARHREARVTRSQVAAFYAAHLGRYRRPAVWNTLMIVTATRSASLAARAALARGKPWAAVAQRFSEDPSALNGGAYNLVEGVHAPALVRAATSARRGAIIGPVEAHPAAQPDTTDYYVFTVTGKRPGAEQPLSQVAPEIGRTLGELAAQHALAAFERAYERQWRERTLCAPGYIVPECRN